MNQATSLSILSSTAASCSKHHVSPAASLLSVQNALKINMSLGHGMAFTLSNFPIEQIK